MTQMTDPTSEPSWTLLRDELVGFVNKRVENRYVAEDIVQDVYVRLQKATPGSILNPQAWLYRAAKNATIDHYRTRHSDQPLDQTAYIDEDDEVGPNEATRELAICLRPLVKQLPATYRRALTLVDLEGLTQAKAASIEGISTSGMKSRVQRGRTKLGNLLTSCCTVTTDRHGAISDYEIPAGDCTCDASAQDWSAKQKR